MSKREFSNDNIQLSTTDYPKDKDNDNYDCYDTIKSKNCDSDFYNRDVCESGYSSKENIKREKKFRRTKNDLENKKFICPVCGKAYYSYPALYTHKRNKHNVIPITGKQPIFKKNKNSYKFKYSALESNNKNIKLRESLEQTYRAKLLDFFADPKCILYSNGFCPDDYPGLHKLKKYSFIPQKEIKEILKNATIDDALAIYLSSFVEVTRKDFFKDLVTTYIILLRTYLNTIGWEYKRKFKDAGVNVEFDYTGAFTSLNDCKEITDLINEFISVFMYMDKKFYIEEKCLKDITMNFCNWLYVNDLTNFKLVTNVDPSCEPDFNSN
jgi:hypothetical protein